MRLKTELLWLGVSLIVSVLIVGLLNGFSAGTIDIQLHDTYFVIDPLSGILFFFFLFSILRYALFVLAVFCLKHKLAVIVFRVIMACASLFMIVFFIYLSYAYIKYSQRHLTAQEGASLVNKGMLAFCVLYASVTALFVSTAWQFWQKSAAYR